MADLEVLLGDVGPLRTAMNPKLFEAATSGDKKILDELLQQEDSSLRDLEEIEITIPKDAATQRYTCCLLSVTMEGNTSLHIVSSKGYLELAMEICHRERSLLAASNMRLDTPLHCAAKAGDDKIVSLIIQFAKKGEKKEARRLLRATNIDGANALHEAAKYNYTSVANILMEGDDKLASMLNNASMSPLYLAVMRKSFDVAKAFLLSFSRKKISAASAIGPDNKTVLHAAVLLSPEIIDDILRWKPMLTRCCDSSLRTPLHYAASNGHHDTVKLLLEHDPSAANLSDVDGLLPIHIAASRGDVSVVEQILEQCPETENLTNKEGKNFLHVAFQRRKLNVVEKIISKRQHLRKLLKDQDSKGNTPLHTAIKNGDQWRVHFLLRDRCVNVDVMNNSGFTPRDLAYAKLDEDLHFSMNAEVCIFSCLALIKAQSTPPELHDLESGELSSKKAKERPSSNEDQKIEKELNLSRNLGVASALIATVTFAAGFTVPGGT